MATHEETDAPAHDRRRNQQARWRRDLVIFGGLLCLLIGIYLYDQERTREANRALFVEAIYRTCAVDHPLRQQYRIRGKAEKLLLQFFGALAAQNVTEGVGDTRASKDFIARFDPLTKKIKVLPVPDCAEQREDLRDQLQ